MEDKSMSDLRISRRWRVPNHSGTATAPISVQRCALPPAFRIQMSLRAEVRRGGRPMQSAFDHVFLLKSDYLLQVAFPCAPLSPPSAPYYVLFPRSFSEFILPPAAPLVFLRIDSPDFFVAASKPPSGPGRPRVGIGVNGLRLKIYRSLSAGAGAFDMEMRSVRALAGTSARRIYSEASRPHAPDGRIAMHIRFRRRRRPARPAGIDPSQKDELNATFSFACSSYRTCRKTPLQLPFRGVVRSPIFMFLRLQMYSRRQFFIMFRERGTHPIIHAKSEFMRHNGAEDSLCSGNRGEVPQVQSRRAALDTSGRAVPAAGRAARPRRSHAVHR
ncbi:hypothetical protein EVAR_4788_1 [Eumeta japonica]|uniref:Uncharacterized protein n=1 Tax=Eumeta variegata TaxID=151549 RepID=A0A4C1T1J7_EUMVA|nr:hypothetical protein EVAR_4788_1 [Eumeta japonica]